MVKICTICLIQILKINKAWKIQKTFLSKEDEDMVSLDIFCEELNSVADPGGAAAPPPNFKKKKPGSGTG